MPVITVISCHGTPIASCHPARARQLLREGKASKVSGKGFFCIKLNADQSNAAPKQEQSLV